MNRNLQLIISFITILQTAGLCPHHTAQTLINLSETPAGRLIIKSFAQRIGYLMRFMPKIPVFKRENPYSDDDSHIPVIWLDDDMISEDQLNHLVVQMEVLSIHNLIVYDRNFTEVKNLIQKIIIEESTSKTQNRINFSRAKDFCKTSFKKLQFFATGIGVLIFGPATSISNPIKTPTINPEPYVVERAITQVPEKLDVEILTTEKQEKNPLLDESTTTSEIVSKSKKHNGSVKGLSDLENPNQIDQTDQELLDVLNEYEHTGNKAPVQSSIRIRY